MAEANGGGWCKTGQHRIGSWLKMMHGSLLDFGVGNAEADMRGSWQQISAAEVGCVLGWKCMAAGCSLGINVV